MNVILEDNNKIQETSYEKQLEKKKENTVVVKKKKPKRKNFGGFNEDNTNEIKENQEKMEVLNMKVNLLMIILMEMENL